MDIRLEIDMNITHQNSDDLNAVITVEIAPEDYNPQVDKAIKDQAKQAKLPGFRPGMVPVSHIRKTVGKALLIDEVNRLVSDRIDQYVEEQKLEVLGHPLPKEGERDEYNWDFNDTFTFEYEIGLTPVFETPFTEKSKFTEYVIKADKETLEERMKNLRRSYGKMSNPEISEDTDVLFGHLVQIDEAGTPVEAGIDRNASLRIDLVHDKAIKKMLIGLKSEDQVTLDIRKAYDLATAARILDITEEGVQATDHPTVRFTVKNINRLEEADLNEEFFTKVFGEGVVNNEKEFEAQVRKEVEDMLVQNATQKLQNDLYLEGMEKVNVDLPEDFLKRWLRATNPEISETELEEGFADFIKNLKWTLIENKIIRDNSLEIQYDEVLDLAKERISAQFQLYGQGQMPELPDEELKQYAIQLLQDKEQSNRLFDEVKSLKVFNYLRSLVKIEQKEIDYDKFLKLD